ncbi:hypothetical protein NVP1081O_253 [Vibrio phage 1.081.O._10N.286.52.C2]|nr:hypothetical protein NVP1081O_253 [Vibrio phage 1.081.O._10N.286.52.C2]
MALPGSGVPMTAALINVELGRDASAAFNLNGAEERALAGIPSGAISLNDFYNKSSNVPIRSGTCGINHYQYLLCIFRTDGTVDYDDDEHMPQTNYWMGTAANGARGTWDQAFKPLKIRLTLRNLNHTTVWPQILDGNGTTTMTTSSGWHTLSSVDSTTAWRIQIPATNFSGRTEWELTDGDGNLLDIITQTY